MRMPLICAAVVSSGIAAGPVLAADNAYSCKSDPRIVESCRWLTGVTGVTLRGEVYLDVGNERAFALNDETLDLVYSFPGRYIAGEFEFCRFKNTTKEVLADVDGTTTQVPIRWGCINAARNVVSEPDFKTQCQYAPGAACKEAGAKP